MGNCYCCLKDPEESLAQGNKRQSNSVSKDITSRYIGKIMNNANYPYRYTKVTLEQTFSDATDEINYLAQLDPQEPYTFSVSIHNIRLYDLNIVNFIDIKIFNRRRRFS